MTLTYDAYNRMSTVNAGSCGYEKYAYGPENRRMWKWRLDDEKEVVYLYGIGGERLGVYKVVEYTSSLGLVTEERALYFGGRRVRTDRTAGLGSEEEEFADRLGSVVWREGTRMSYYPYGEEKGTTTEQGRDKFGTYHRDEVTGLDYAVNRYYGSGLGRFLSADPYDGSGAVKSPQSWNRYGYVRGDPVNFSDPSGLLPCPAGYFYNHEIEDCQPSYVPSPGPHGQDTLPQDPEPLPASMWTNTDHPGIQAAASTLVSLIGWVPEGTCRDFLTQLAGGAGISTDDLISQFQAAAKEAVSFVYDGPSSSRNLDPDDFPGAAGPGVTTVGQWFGADRKREGLSQFNGAAIWIRQDDWNGWGSGYFAGSAPTAYGRGTMMHELLHKASVGGGFSHSQMNAALEAVGAPVRDLYKNEISSPLGKICF
jgi:RHS repeat-associated protein